MCITSYDRRSCHHYCRQLEILLLVASIISLSGCMTSSRQYQEQLKAPPLPVPEVQESTHADPLSYGMVTGRVKKNVTTQQDLIELFGGPSVMTTDRDDTEVWMYDRTSTVSSSSYASSSTDADHSEAAVMAGFFGLSVPLGVGAAGGAYRGQSANVAKGSNSATHSVKTITFIVKFNPDRTVKDYAVRQASY